MVDDHDLWTIGEALDFCDPDIPRRTLARLLTGLSPAGRKTLPNGGPPVAVYRCADIMTVHAQWWRRRKPARPVADQHRRGLPCDQPEVSHQEET